MNETTSIPAIFGSDVFSEGVMRTRLAPRVRSEEHTSELQSLC